MPPEIEAIKHVGDWVDGKLVCRPDCPSITHKTNMTHNTDIEEVVARFRPEILALPNYNLTVQEDLEQLLTTYRTTILKERDEKIKELEDEVYDLRKGRDST